MEYTSLIAIVLGMISVIITLKYIKYYDDFNKKLAKLNKNCLGNNIPKSLINIQNEMEMTDADFAKLVEKNRDKILNILKEETPEQDTDNTETVEGFANYGYTGAGQRGLENLEFSEYILPQKVKKRCRIKKYSDNISNIYKNSILMKN